MDTRSLNSNYNLKLTVLSPLHIGAGTDKNWVRGYDYVEFQGKVHILDKNKLFHNLEDLRLLDAYVRATDSGKWFEVEKLINNQLEVGKISTLIFRYEGGALSNEIRTLARDGEGRIYIPGSSLKGAITSSIFHYLWGNTNPKGYNRFINNDLLGTFGQSIMRYIRPSDAYMQASHADITNVALFNLYANGSEWSSEYKSGFKISVEHFKAKANGHFRLSIADGLGTLIHEIGQKNNHPVLPKFYHHTIQPDPALHLFKMINQCTSDHISRELAFFRAYDQADDTDFIIQQLEGLQQRCTASPRSCVLRMAGHSGFHSMTGDWRFPNHQSTIRQPDADNKTWSQRTRQKEPARYKSRKVMANGDELLLGFVGLEIE